MEFTIYYPTSGAFKVNGKLMPLMQAHEMSGGRMIERPGGAVVVLDPRAVVVAPDGSTWGPRDDDVHELMDDTFTEWLNDNPHWPAELELATPATSPDAGAGGGA